MTLSALSLLTFLAGCKNSANGPVDISEAVGATGWGENVGIDLDEEAFIYTSDGYPNHALNAEYIMPDALSPCLTHPTPDCSHIESVEESVQPHDVEVEITTRPEYTDEISSSDFGAMGVMISGVHVYNPFEGDGVTVAMNANFTMTNDNGDAIPFMDDCNAHPSPHPMAMYHYHGLPGCVTAQVDEEGGPSHIIGIAFDGFPIYGDRDINGDPIDPTTLDDCNGIESPTPEFPDGLYH